MVAVGFLALGYGELNGAHVKMEYFGEKFFGKYRKYLQLFVLLVVISFFVIMTMQIGARANSDRIAKILISNSNLPLPVWWQSAIATAGSGMLVLALIVEFIRKLLMIILKVPEKSNSIISEKQGA
jgi:TRAP-type C4-dicarboxylate transport system permease small subunit